MEQKPIVIEFDNIEYIIDNYEYVYTDTIPVNCQLKWI